MRNGIWKYSDSTSDDVLKMENTHVQREKVTVSSEDTTV